MTDWQDIVSRHTTLVWQTAYRLLGHAEDASDCFQDAFVTALSISRRQPVRNWAALLVRVTTCRALDRLRRRMRHAARRGSPVEWAVVESHDPRPDERAEADELSSRLRQALAELPPKQAEVFCLRFFDELSYRDIARQLNMKTSAVGVLLHRARQRLRELLEPVVTEEETEVSR